MAFPRIKNITMTPISVRPCVICDKESRFVAWVQTGLDYANEVPVHCCTGHKDAAKFEFRRWWITAQRKLAEAKQKESSNVV